MPKAAIVVLADTATHADLGRVVNALITTKEFKDAGVDVRLIFDGAATQGPASSPTPPARHTSLTRPSATSSPAPAVFAPTPSTPKTTCTTPTSSCSANTKATPASAASSRTDTRS